MILLGHREVYMSEMKVGDYLSLFCFNPIELEFNGPIVEIKRYPDRAGAEIVVNNTHRQSKSSFLSLITIYLTTKQFLDLSCCRKTDWQGKELSLAKAPEPMAELVCQHTNKRKVAMISSSYWYCPDCKKDLGNA